MRPQPCDLNASVRPPAQHALAYILLVFIFLSVLIKIPTLRYPHQENDEIIYTTLAQSLITRGEYSLQGTEILSKLSPTIYDHPLFNHPPLFPALLTPFVLLSDINHAVLISWLGHILAIIGVGLIIQHASRHSKDPPRVTDMVFWLPLLAVTADPLLLFVSRKLWIEGILCGLFTFSAALLIIAEDSKWRRTLLFSVGITLGLAALAKISVLALLPVYLYAMHLFFRKRGVFVSSCLWLLLPVAALTAPWFVAFYMKCGVFLPDWINPDPWSMDRFPLMKEWANRPWYFYLIKTPLLIPVLPLCLYRLLRTKSLLAERSARIALLFILCHVTVLSLLGARGLGFQLRHLTVIGPMISVLVYHTLPEKALRPWLNLAFVLCIFVGAVGGLMYLLAPNFDDLMVLTDFLGK